MAVQHTFMLVPSIGITPVRFCWCVALLIPINQEIRDASLIRTFFLHAHARVGECSSGCGGRRRGEMGEGVLQEEVRSTSSVAWLVTLNSAHHTPHPLTPITTSTHSSHHPHHLSPPHPLTPHIILYTHTHSFPSQEMVVLVISQ